MYLVGYERDMKTHPISSIDGHSLSDRHIIGSSDLFGCHFQPRLLWKWPSNLPISTAALVIWCVMSLHNFYPCSSNLIIYIKVANTHLCLIHL